jgi:hypothetical protein
MKNGARKTKIIAYGFDAAGFAIPSDPIEADTYTIRFLGYGAEQSLTDAQGVIVPSGIFERIKSNAGLYGGDHRWVEWDKDTLAKREKQVFQNFKNDCWSVFLLRGVQNGPWRGSAKWKESDLAKRLLNAFFNNVVCHDPDPHIHCKADEFAAYLHDFGISRTTFGSPIGDHKPRMLAGEQGRMAAAELFGKFFFLPLPSIAKGRAEVTTLVTKCAEAVLEYKRRNELYLPGWVEAVAFKSEKRLDEDIQNLEMQVVLRRDEISKWRRYKGILSATGRPLNVLVVEIFRDFFGLNLRSTEEYVEDALIYDTNGNPLFVVEIKGVNGGLKRDHVNQVDSHRERLGVSPDVSGLLVLNDFTDVDGLDERKDKTFDALHLTHAEKLNIKILRTSTLLEIILFLEERDECQRTQVLLQLLTAAKPLVGVPDDGPVPPVSSGK